MSSGPRAVHGSLAGLADGAELRLATEEERRYVGRVAKEAVVERKDRKDHEQDNREVVDLDVHVDCHCASGADG